MSIGVAKDVKLTVWVAAMLVEEGNVLASRPVASPAHNARRGKNFMIESMIKQLLAAETTTERVFLWESRYSCTAHSSSVPWRVALKAASCNMMT